MGIAAVKIKLMPTSPSVNLEKIKEQAKEIIEINKGKNPSFSEELIAFGLKAIIIFFAWPEEKELELLEKELGDIENVQSVQVVDMRRAIG
ncbi:MAG: elongation factor 1-beta [Nanoarchaeota archaeon]|nr:elongation factor 1-beta [Nanoarchaeota archaeon]